MTEVGTKVFDRETEVVTENDWVVLGNVWETLGNNLEELDNDDKTVVKIRQYEFLYWSGL